MVLARSPRVTSLRYDGQYNGRSSNSSTQRFKSMPERRGGFARGYCSTANELFDPSSAPLSAAYTLVAFVRVSWGISAGSDDAMWVSRERHRARTSSRHRHRVHRSRVRQGKAKPQKLTRREMPAVLMNVRVAGATLGRRQVRVYVVHTLPPHAVPWGHRHRPSNIYCLVPRQVARFLSCPNKCTRSTYRRRRHFCSCRMKYLLGLLQYLHVCEPTTIALVTNNQAFDQAFVKLSSMNSTVAYGYTRNEPAMSSCLP
jgi:hypothetical protein